MSDVTRIPDRLQQGEAKAAEDEPKAELVKLRAGRSPEGADASGLYGSRP